ncbi:MAG: hypothetical protein J6A69_04815 [Clostridia bacterium]|nr:hypothetical protein [Clostridia bacterium]
MEKFKLWEPKTQPDILGNDGSFGNIEWDYPTFVEKIYEPLRRKYPDYIKRHSIGFDTSGEYEMWAYEFAPENYTKTIYIQSGVHVIETDAYFGLARVLTMIANREDERLSKVRDNVRFLVVPVVSIWGISKRGGYEEMMSKDRYNFSHNAAHVNANRDFFELKAKETVNVINFIEKYSKDICFAIDCHSTTDVVLGAYLLPYSDGMPESIANKLKHINSELYKKHPTEIPNLFMGEEKYYPTGALTSTYNAGITKKFGIFALTIEHNDYIYDKKLGTSLAMTLSVELIGNHLIQISEDEEFIKTDCL